MIQFSKEYLREHIYACWLGKNIGGTMGTPFEGQKTLNDISGFNSKPGEPLPNDDLDLQLVWLRAVNDYGIKAINSKLLGEYWVSFINPCWNEYGICKSNMHDGILPPMSGEIGNETWKHSNGAWIRTEVWASLFPGSPDQAIRLAYEDASVDHGLNEGTYAAIFIAAMESAAYIVKDVNTLLDIGLSKIPETCRVARSVNIVRKAYKDGIDWKKTREMVLEDSADLGWFQAPANVAFTMIGLLYGEGDFKKSMIIAIDCGDDTDCTGATIGSIMGIMGGMEVIPADWRAYIGDEIKTICLTNGHGRYPDSCTELTNCILNLLPETLRQNHQDIFNGKDNAYVLGDENDFSALDVSSFYGHSFVDSIALRKPCSYVIEGYYADATVEFDTEPFIEPNGTLTGRISLRPHTMPEQKRYRLSFYTPEGWSIEAKKNLQTLALGSDHFEHAFTDFIIRAGENVDAMNKLVCYIECAGRPMPILVPIQILG